MPNVALAHIPMLVARPRTPALRSATPCDAAPATTRESLAAPVTLALVVLAAPIGAAAVALVTALGA